MHAWEALLRETTSSLGGFETRKLEALAQRAESLAHDAAGQLTILEIEHLSHLRDTLSALLGSTKRSIQFMHDLRVERTTRGFSNLNS